MHKLINTIACASLAILAAACVSGENGVVEKTDGNRVSYKFTDNKNAIRFKLSEYLYALKINDFKGINILKISFRIQNNLLE